MTTAKFFNVNLDILDKNRLKKLKLTLIIEMKNLIQLLVFVMSHFSQTFSVDLVEFLLKRRHLKKSAKTFVNNKKFNIMMKKV